MGVQAVYVGWGFASENPILSEKLSALKSKPVFIGPPANAMRSLGDKFASTIVAQSANVPTISWSGEGITVDAKDKDGYIYVPQDVYDKATPSSSTEGNRAISTIALILLLKCFVKRFETC